MHVANVYDLGICATLENRGPWDKEKCDEAYWVDEATQLHCAAVRTWTGSWCGYVGVPPTSILYGKHYNEIDGAPDATPHGGFTYADDHHTGNHEAFSGVWYFGFDCAHYFDLVPRYLNYYQVPSVSGAERDATYRTLDFVIEQCTKLAQALFNYTGEEHDTEPSPHVRITVDTFGRVTSGPLAISNGGTGATAVEPYDRVTGSGSLRVT